MSVYKNVLLIDSSVKEHDIFISSCNTSTLPIVYESSTTSTMVLYILKANFTTIDRVAICFASKPGQINIFLDNQFFIMNHNVKFIISIIKEFNIKNIDYLACNTLIYPEWVNYYELIKTTGVIVGASNDQTGNIKYGDWVMESTKEDIELIYFTKSIEYYSYLLDSSGYSTFVITNNNTLYGSGYNYYGQLGLGNSNNNVDILTEMINIVGKTPLSILAGYYYTIVLMTDGTVYGTGYNQYGQLGLGNYNSVNVLTQMLDSTGLDFITNVKYLMNEQFVNSNICFQWDTPILTDQGTIMIQNINRFNTINNKTIVCIRTISTDKYLVCFAKHALGFNCPNKETVMSQSHSIYYNGKMIIAKKFIGYNKKIYKIKYNGEVLYNVLMEDYSKINVNNMICETLHPDNAIAKLYTNNSIKFKNAL